MPVGVSAAEKYAELEERGEPRPRCKCHDVAMIWNKSGRGKHGGFWVCSIKRKKYLEDNREYYKRYHKKYREDNREQYNEWRRNTRRRRRELGLCKECENKADSPNSKFCWSHYFYNLHWERNRQLAEFEAKIDAQIQELENQRRNHGLSG